MNGTSSSSCVSHSFFHASGGIAPGFKPALDEQAWLRDPVLQYVAGESWLYFCAAPTLWGVSVWGHPARDDIARLLRSLRLSQGACPVPRLVLDMRGLMGIDAAGFELLHNDARARGSLLSNGPSRQALARPHGLLGAVATAFFDLLGAHRVSSAFNTLGESLGWLAPELAPRLSEAIHHLCGRAQHSPPLVASLRVEIGKDCSASELDRIASRLGVSGRTLQRRLEASGTTFRDEVNAAKLCEAKRRVALPGASITTIAIELGFGSGQNFSRWFRRLAGTTPTEWRARTRLTENGVSRSDSAPYQAFARSKSAPDLTGAGRIEVVTCERAGVVS